MHLDSKHNLRLREERMAVDLKQIADNLIKGKAPEVKELVQKVLDEGVDVEKVLNEGLIAGMNVVGVKFKANEFYVPEVLIAARAMKAGMEQVWSRYGDSKTDLS